MKKLITMLSALTITSSIAPLTVACGKEKELKGEAINVDTIDANMIINWKKAYTSNDDTNVTVDKLNTLNKNQLASIIRSNLYDIIGTKITGLNESAFSEKGSENLNDSEWKNFIIFRSFLINDMHFFSDSVKPTDISPLYIDIRSSNDENDKKFDATINVKKWDGIKDILQTQLNESKVAAAELKKTDEDRKNENKKGTEGMTDAEIEKAIKTYVQICKTFQKIDLESIKAMYDLIQIKDETKTIEVNLNSSN